MRRYQAEAPFDGRNVTILAFSVNAGERTYFIDLERGAVPVLVRETDPKAGSTSYIYLDQLAFENGAGWLPHRMTTFIDDSRTVLQVTILRATLDARPDRTTFRLTFPEAVRLFDRTRNISYDTPRTSWSLLDLPNARPNAPRVGTLGYQPPEQDMPGEQHPHWISGRQAFFLSAFALLIVGLVIVRYRIRGRMP